MTNISGVDLSALERWMEDKGLGEGRIAEVSPLSGGTQNLLVRFRRGARGFVLRRPPAHLRANSNETMRREARVLKALSTTAVPHPKLIAACPDEGVLGAAFYLMEPVEGFNPTTGLPAFHAASAEVRRRMGFALVEGITALGALDYRVLGLEGFGKPENYLARQVDRWGAQLTTYAEHGGWTGPDALPGVDQVARWLQANRPSDFEPGILHGDYHLSNVLYRPDGPELAAIVDWELSTIGDPLLDLGWLLATWPEDETPRDYAVGVTPWAGFPSADELVEHYRLNSRRDLSAIDWYAVMACYKLGIILEGTHARACAGKAPRQTGDRLHAHAIALFDRALRWIR